MSEFFLIKDVEEWENGIYVSQDLVVAKGTYQELSEIMDNIDLRGGDSSLFHATSYVRPITPVGYEDMLKFGWGAV
jgi:hypothetical protein